MCSVYSVPLLFLNLGGEMIYILNQRLNAQRIPKDKAMTGGCQPQDAIVLAIFEAGLYYWKGLYL